jgi:hypothetical protein
MASGSPPLTIQRFEELEGQIVTILASIAKILKVGDFALFPFTVEELPDGWYHRNGDRYDVASAQGVVLAGLSEPFKDQWGITIVNSTINVPTAYHTDGRPYFDRAVNGTTRLPGSIEQDAIRNIKSPASNTGPLPNEGSETNRGGGGPFGVISTSAVATFKAAPFTFHQGLYGVYKSGYRLSAESSSHAIYYYGFDASTISGLPTAAENRVLNRGQTPAIYLGV